MNSTVAESDLNNATDSDHDSSTSIAAVEAAAIEAAASAAAAAAAAAASEQQPTTEPTSSVRLCELCGNHLLYFILEHTYLLNTRLQYLRLVTTPGPKHFFLKFPKDIFLYPLLYLNDKHSNS